MSRADPFAAFAGQKYLSLETFRKSGAGVRTPVWFADEPADKVRGRPATVYVYTVQNSGKVKRIRNNPAVRIAPCNMRGEVRGVWVDARAEIIEGDEAKHAMKLLNRKYSPWKQILDLFALFGKHKRELIALHSV